MFVNLYYLSIGPSSELSTSPMDQWSPYITNQSSFPVASRPFKQIIREELYAQFYKTSKNLCLLWEAIIGTGFFYKELHFIIC